MPGLLNAAPSAPARGATTATPAQTGVAQPGKVSPDNADASGAEGNVSPEEQAQYDAFVTNGMKLMNDEKGIDGLLKSIQGDGDPIQGLANTVAAIVIRVEDSAQKQGVEISPDVLMHGGTELLEQAADLAEQAGIHEFSEEDLESALYQSMDIYRSMREGKLPTEQLGQDLQKLQAAEQDGSLEEMFPGITEFGNKSPAPPPRNAQPPAGQPSRGLLR